MISIHLYYIQSTIYPESYFSIAWHRALPWLDDYPYISDNASIGMKITLIPFNDHNMSLGMLSFNSPTRNSGLVKEWRWGGSQKPKIIWRPQNEPLFESTLRVFLKPSLMYIVHLVSTDREIHLILVVIQSCHSCYKVIFSIFMFSSLAFLLDSELIIYSIK